MKKGISLLYIQILLLYSCSKSQTDPKVDHFEEGNLDVPTVLPLVDSKCATGIDSLAGLSYWSWNGKAVESQMYRETFWQSPDIMNSPVVFSTLYGFQEINTVKDSCSDKLKVGQILEGDCIASTKVSSPPQKLRICPEHSYPRYSIEGAALSIAAPLEKTYHYLSSVDPDHDIGSLALLVLPDIRFNIPGRDAELAITDNAGWALSDKVPGISQYLVFYPMSKTDSEQRQVWQASFWEVPWIVSHEYGHHIFYHYLSGPVKSYFGYNDTSQSLAPFHQRWLQASAAATYAQQHTFTGINEAVADLIAHYTMDNDSLQMASLSCSFAYRDVNSPYLNDGSDKKFRTGDFTEVSSDPCRHVDFSDVHTVGAILAYYLDQSIQIAGYESPSRKGKLILQILKTFVAKLTDRVPAVRDDDLVPLLVDAVMAVHEDRGASDQCALMDQTFGQVFTYPFSMSYRYPDCENF